jgi:hypothetical protein
VWGYTILHVRFHNKPWFDEGCSKLIDQRKQAKLQWLQDPSEINGDNPNNIRRETSRHFRNEKREYLKDKIDELATNNKNMNFSDLYRGINDFKSYFFLWGGTKSTRYCGHFWPIVQTPDDR